MENNTAELKDFIKKLITSQNELIRNLGVNISADEESPFDSAFDAVIETARRSKKDASAVLKKEKEKSEEKIAFLEKELSELSTENDRLKGLIKEKDENNKTIAKELEDANKKMTENESEYKEKVDALEIKLKESEKTNEEEIKKIKEEMSAKCELADDFSKHAEPYQALLDKICSCKSLSDYCEQNKLTNSRTVGNTLKFMRMASSASYVRTLLTKMKDYKKINTYSVSEDEKALMKEINFFYKTHSSKITEDILYFPSGIDNDKTSGLNVPYNSSEMKSIDYGLPPKYVTEIITPCCKIDDTVEPAYVRGKSED